MRDDRLTAEIRDVLWTMDPLGVADDREDASDEYETGISALRQLVATSPSTRDYEVWWNEYVRGLGLVPRQSDAAELARRMRGVTG